MAIFPITHMITLQKEPYPDEEIYQEDVSGNFDEDWGEKNDNIQNMQHATKEDNIQMKNF